MNKKDFKEKLRRIGLTQKKFASIVDYSYSAVKGWQTVPRWAEMIIDYLEVLHKVDKAVHIAEDLITLKKSIHKIK